MTCFRKLAILLVLFSLAVSSPAIAAKTTYLGFAIETDTEGFRGPRIQRARVSKVESPVRAPRSAKLKQMAGAAFLMLITFGSTGAGQTPANPIAEAWVEFDARVKEYLVLHQKLANETGAIDETKDPKQIADRERALGQAIRSARSQAKRGDLFTPAVEVRFKQVVAAESKRRSAGVRADRREDQDELADFTPTVNQVYPSNQPLVTFPAGLLRTLPKLPRELEYRFVQRNLILRDIEANLIIDFIPAATL